MQISFVELKSIESAFERVLRKATGKTILLLLLFFFMIHDDIHSCYIHVNMVKSNMLVKTIIIYVRMYMHVYFDDKIKSRSRYLEGEG